VKVDKLSTNDAYLELAFKNATVVYLPLEETYLRGRNDGV
jgi:hypothetical protein